MNLLSSHNTQEIQQMSMGEQGEESKLWFRNKQDLF